ncbi:MAG: hypothetical protein JOZ58_02695 [Acetobacteraceae bacterium]|nr:hypothetical protein [Acetobacteraceae bacterium]
MAAVAALGAGINAACVTEEQKMRRINGYVATVARGSADGRLNGTMLQIHEILNHQNDVTPVGCQSVCRNAGIPEHSQIHRGDGYLAGTAR